MVICESYNEKLIRHYSDSGVKILQNETGIIYDEAIDILPCSYTYSETEEEVEKIELDNDYYIKHYKLLLDTITGE